MHINDDSFGAWGEGNSEYGYSADQTYQQPVPRLYSLLHS